MNLNRQLMGFSTFSVDLDLYVEKLSWLNKLGQCIYYRRIGQKHGYQTLTSLHCSLQPTCVNLLVPTDAIKLETETVVKPQIEGHGGGRDHSVNTKEKELAGNILMNNSQFLSPTCWGPPN